jgi:hypothetical protein
MAIVVLSLTNEFEWLDNPNFQAGKARKGGSEKVALNAFNCGHFKLTNGY